MAPPGGSPRAMRRQATVYTGAAAAAAASAVSAAADQDQVTPRHHQRPACVRLVSAGRTCARLYVCLSTRLSLAPQGISLLFFSIW